MNDEISPSDDLQRVRLLQEKEAKARELALKEREIEFQHQEREKELSLRENELEFQQQHQEKELSLREGELMFQRQQTWWTRWSAPAVVAIVAGLIGYVGTLFTSLQNQKLEREKQEATLILEAIKTGGSAEERTRQASANLIFLADAGLITTIKAAELEKLRAKAQGAGPSLPPPQGVTFQRSSTLTQDLESTLQSALKAYQSRLSSIGYNLGQEGSRVTVRVSEEAIDLDNAYFDPGKETIVVGVNLARDPEYLLSEYTWHVLKATNPKALLLGGSIQFDGFSQALKYYVTCSYLDSPIVGKNYRSLASAAIVASLKTSYLFNLAQFRAYDKRLDIEPHHLGEVWGGALWELREKLGREQADRLILGAWKGFPPEIGQSEDPKQYVVQIVQAGTSLGVNAQLIQQAFDRRNLR